MKSVSQSHHQFFGTTTLGEKGQLVIPAEARVTVGLKTGQKLLVFAMGNGMIALAKLEHLAKFEQALMKRLQVVRKAVRSAR